MSERFFKIKVGETEVWMEAEEEAVTDRTPTPVSAQDQLENAVQVADSISNTIRAYCSTLVESFNNFQSEHKPDKVTAEFGIKLSGEGNVYVVKTSGEASLKISAEWSLT